VRLEINRLNAVEVSIDSGTGNGLIPHDVAIGALALDPDTGSSNFAILGTQRIDVTGTITADGSAATRVIRLGGSSNPDDRTEILRVASTATGGGGRIIMPSANVELRGAKIGVGQDLGFLQDLGLTAGGTPLNSTEVARAISVIARSSLYDASIGGDPYIPSRPNPLSGPDIDGAPRRLCTVQNTGGAGFSHGTVLGTDPAKSRFVSIERCWGAGSPNSWRIAMFGAINGTSEAGAAILGVLINRIDTVDRADVRINGCIVGSVGGGCFDQQREPASNWGIRPEQSGSLQSDGWK
jgi:hypothetical protein